MSSTLTAFSLIEDSLATLLLRTLTMPQDAARSAHGHIAMALLEVRLARIEQRERPKPAPRGGLAGWQVRVACDHLATQVDLCHAVRSAADACQISRSHFSRAFKISMGVTPTRFHIEQRVQRAQRLLENRRLAIADIAAECGFADQSHFTNTFSRLCRQSPAAWRRQAAAYAVPAPDPNTVMAASQAA